MHFKIEFDREDDGRWIAEVPELPGVIVYARDRAGAIAAVQALALRVLTDRVEHGEIEPGLLGVSFETHTEFGE
jgi:predicted RNase H-like HicB family nuclease